MNIALLVSINNYPGNELRGCLNDQENIRKHLVEDFGFSPMHIKCLRDSLATKDNILSNLSNMIDQMQEGDHGVFHFSGHGSQVPDRDSDEPDGLDEVLCPYGFDFTSQTTISDDDLRRILGKLRPGATLDCIFDSCHSGTGTRDGDGIPRCIPFPVPIAPSMRTISPLLREMEQPNIALWAGCRSNQTSADAYIDGKYQGAMTWAFCKAIGKSGYTWRVPLHDRIKQILELNGYDQEPQLECSDAMRQREIFT